MITIRYRQTPFIAALFFCGIASFGVLLQGQEPSRSNVSSDPNAMQRPNRDLGLAREYWTDQAQRAADQADRALADRVMQEALIQQQHAADLAQRAANQGKFVISQGEPVNVQVELVDETAKSILAAKQQLREAQDDSSRTAAAAELKKQLEAAFDRDFERRNEHLTKIEERIATLRAELDRRKAARDEIIDVRVKSLRFEAEGIGFPDAIGNEGRPWMVFEKRNSGQDPYQSNPSSFETQNFSNTTGSDGFDGETRLPPPPRPPMPARK